MVSEELKARLRITALDLLADAAHALDLSIEELSQAVDTPVHERSDLHTELLDMLTSLADEGLRRRKYTDAVVDDFYVRAQRGEPGEATFIGGIAALRFHGYSADEIESLPSPATTRFLGLGNAWHGVSVDHGAKVLDVGCGSGVDLGIAQSRIGPSGVLVGVDKRPLLLVTAALASPRASLLVGEVEALPALDVDFDLVIANGLPPLQRPATLDRTASLLCGRAREGAAVTATVIVTSPEVVSSIGAAFPERTERFHSTMATMITGKPTFGEVKCAFERAGSATLCHRGANPYLDPIDRQLTAMINVVATRTGH